MEQMKKLLGLQTAIDSLSKQMTALKQEVSVIETCLKEEELIPESVSAKVINGLYEIERLNDKCKMLYTNMELGLEIPAKIRDIRLDITEAIKDLELKDLLFKYRQFLQLETKDPETKVLLDAKQEELEAILSTYESNKEPDLEPYHRFVEAVTENDSTKLVEYMLELAGFFNKDLLGKAIIQRNIFLPEDKKTNFPLIQEVSANSELAQETKPDFIANQETVASQNDYKADENSSDTQNQNDLNSASETEEIATEAPMVNEIIAEVKERDLLLTDTSKLGNLLVNISPNENKKFGVKVFKKDIKDKYAITNAVSFKFMEKHDSVTAEMISLITEMKLEEINLSLKYLQGKGYIREYKIENLGLFYRLSPRGLKAFQAQDACSFLKVKPGAKNESISDIGDNLHSVLARAVYAKMLLSYYKYLGENISNESEFIWKACFVYSCSLENQESAQAILGVFWESADEAARYIRKIELEQIANYKSLVIAGVDLPFVKRLASFLIEKLELDTSRLYYYGTLEDTFISHEQGEKVALKAILISEEETAEPEKAGKDIKVEQQETPKDLINNMLEILDDLGEEVQTTPKEALDLEVPAKAEELELPETKIDVQAEYEFNEILEQNFVIEVQEALNNSYQMIAEEKIYCATTYLRSLMESDAEIKSWYHKLAYAVNDPWLRCSYSSQEIFSLYSGSEDSFSEYLMAAAALRNFFMNHVSYDYDLKPLQANLKNLSVVQESTELANIIYELVKFKDEQHKGIDFYADYKIKDELDFKSELESVIAEAISCYNRYILSPIKESASHRRLLKTKKLIFAQDSNLAKCLKSVADNDYNSAGLVINYLADTFIKKDCSLEYCNLDANKLKVFINSYWDKAGDLMGAAIKTSDLVSSLRNNLSNSIEKILKVMCEWTALIKDIDVLEDDIGSLHYQEVKKNLLSDMNQIIEQLASRTANEPNDRLAGAMVLKNTVLELIARLDGSYNEKKHKYYYIDFLRGNKVLLQENFLPDLRGKFGDFLELSLANRILKHSQANLMSFEERLEDIFNNYGDDYGTADLIMKYLFELHNISFEEQYNIKKSEEMAAEGAKQNLKDFIENLELAQSYGQIEETKDNKKEKIQQTANEWYKYAVSSKNYGFFKMILEQYKKKIQKEAKVRGAALQKELEQIQENQNESQNETREIKLRKIQEMINNQNYTVAEDLLSRINSDESDEAIELARTDYLKKFIKDYDYNYRNLTNSGRKLADLVSPTTRNKDDKGAKKLIDNWMSNGQALGVRKLSALLEALGFIGAKVKEQPSIDKLENYSVIMERLTGRKVNYKHPVAAFGSKAGEDGFLVVCLFGRYDADRLIAEFKNITGTKNTLVLLDWALSLPDRRRLARKIKSDLNGKVFAVLDRVMLMFLVNNYNVQLINQILMSVMMPFSYYQPYVWDSSKVMPPEIFMGRKDELEKIESPSGVNIVYGGRQLGKSALLKKAKMDIDKDENHNRAVLVEIKGLNYAKAAQKIGHELYDAGVLTAELDTTDWDELARAIKIRLQNSELPAIPYLLLLLDEADTFIESCEPINFRPFDALKEIQNVGMDRFKFVIAGLHNIVRFKRDAALSNNSVLPHLTSITIKPFSPMEARLLLETPLYYLGFRFPEDKQSLVSLILANTNYFPGLIQLYCANLIEAMRKRDYAGYDEFNTPEYEIRENHIKKVLSDADFMNQIREKFEITLKLDEDNLYYIIALLMAYLYHQNANSASESEGFSAKDLIKAGQEYEVKKIAELDESKLNGLLLELLELNILRQTTNELYLFSRYSFFQMMGTSTEVEDKLMEYMGE